MVGAHEFIMDLPKGYDTEWRGRQDIHWTKQLISFARAIIADPKMLSSTRLQAPSILSLRRRSKRRARDCFVTEQALLSPIGYLIRDADRILVIDSGEVIEQGSHNELMELRLLLRTVYNQFKTEKIQESVQALD